MHASCIVHGVWHLQGCQNYEIKRTKCVRWMPRRLQAMKDVAVCDKLRGAGNRL